MKEGIRKRRAVVGVRPVDRLPEEVRPERLVDVPTAAQFLAVSRPSIYNFMERGWIPFVKMGHARRIRLSDLERFVKEHTVSA